MKEEDYISTNFSISTRLDENGKYDAIITLGDSTATVFGRDTKNGAVFDAINWTVLFSLISKERSKIKDYS